MIKEKILHEFFIWWTRTLRRTFLNFLIKEIKSHRVGRMLWHCIIRLLLCSWHILDHRARYSSCGALWSISEKAHCNRWRHEEIFSSNPSWTVAHSKIQSTIVACNFMLRLCHICCLIGCYASRWSDRPSVCSVLVNTITEPAGQHFLMLAANIYLDSGMKWTKVQSHYDLFHLKLRMNMSVISHFNTNIILIIINILIMTSAKGQFLTLKL